MKARFNYGLVRFLMLTLIVFSFSNASVQEKTKKQLKEEAKLKKQKEVDLLVNSKEFVFSPRSVSPQGGRSITLTDVSYSMEFHPDLIKSYLPFFGRDLSVVYNMQGKNQQALQTLQTALKNDAKNERIYYNMALLFNEMNKISEAEKAFAKAVELKSMNPKVYYNYGLLLNQNKKYKEAEKVLLKGLTLNPSDGELYYALTFVYIQTNNKGKAQETGLKLKQLEPNNPNYQQLFASLGI